jgi:hypothetical protein
MYRFNDLVELIRTMLVMRETLSFELKRVPTDSEIQNEIDIILASSSSWKKPATVEEMEAVKAELKIRCALWADSFSE